MSTRARRCYTSVQSIKPSVGPHGWQPTGTSGFDAACHHRTCRVDHDTHEQTGNQATGEYYYRLLNDGLNARLGGWDNGEIVIVSVNFGNIEHFVRTGQWAAAGVYLASKVDALERAGADLVLCTSNTMHRVVEPIMSGRSTSFIHIADPTGEAIRTAGLCKVGLLGTMSVMRSAQFARRFLDRFGVELVTPGDDDAELVDRIIFDELVRRDLRANSRRAYLTIIEKLSESGAQGLILGCTELFLIVRQDDVPNVEVFDTTALHVAAAVRFALEVD